MWRKFNLRTRIYLLLVALLVIAFSSGGVMMWYTYRIQGLFNGMIDRNMAAFESAASLEVALVKQKGFVTYYFMDGDPDWLRQYDAQRLIFQKQLRHADALARSGQQKAGLEQISQRYHEYIEQKDRVIGYYKRGEMKLGAELHRSVRQLFFDVIDLCEQYKLLHLGQIREARKEVADGARKLRLVTAVTLTIHMILVVGLGVLLVHQILVPVWEMLKSTARDHLPDPSENMMNALGRNIDDLLVNVDRAHQELEKSRENLLQAKKMAMVGRLAAGMAHSIRNPFTSVKMRLFSLGRSLKLDAAQKEDFDVISQEIRHIDTIVQNFLEFSRPPKLIMQPISPSVIVDNALQLLSHRLDSYGVHVEVIRSEALPEVMADPEQLKEVLVNLIINACEETRGGGSIAINEYLQNEDGIETAVLTISDNGSGVPPDIAESIFQPFFTTKDEGTGLGLSIAKRIVEEHGGSIDLDMEDTAGATFVIHLPVKEH